jgi:hypothetical protein
LRQRDIGFKTSDFVPQFSGLLAEGPPPFPNNFRHLPGRINRSFLGIQDGIFHQPKLLLGGLQTNA